MRVLALTAAAVLVAGCGHAKPSARATRLATATVERGDLSSTVSQAGTLTYRARADGSPYSVINRARGTYTQLPSAGDTVGCGGVLYRVDNRPVILLCGMVPAYRALGLGQTGPDVGQLNRNLRVAGDAFTLRTAVALRALQRARGLRATGALALGEAVFLPEPLRIAKVDGTLGAGARPGAPVMTATSGRLQVRVALDPSQHGRVSNGDVALITLPDNAAVKGKVIGFGRVGKTIPISIGLEDPAKARGLDQAPVQVDITTGGVKDVLSVPVTALVGRSGGGFAVEVVGAHRRLVPVRLGLFDPGGGRVQVEGDIRAGDAVVVPSL